ncbi:hypothetical protein PVAP13_3NG117636 [Panicum virgatum]|uniref:Uncharacterized protein n=1 Tax=Panicum virgatum TaxID=38727 RepID=A0A8T0U1A9_PANVG|nr:hypothetical protein PVAP13_3NG117636 [Panicum virgatum]
MEFPEMCPGNPDVRPEHVVTCMARTSALVEEERNLELHALLAVQLDARARISDELVRRDALRQLRISELSLKVTKVGPGTFLLRFADPALRTTALGTRALSVGHTSLRFRPWTRQFGAQASKLRYRMVAPLFGPSSFVEDICDKKYLDKECLCPWIWTVDLSAIAKSGTLQLEEPIMVTEEYFIHLGNMGSPYVRHDQAEMLKFLHAAVESTPQ